MPNQIQHQKTLNASKDTDSRQKSRRNLLKHTAAFSLLPAVNSMQLNASTAISKNVGSLPEPIYGSFMKDNELWQAQDVDAIQIAKGFSWYPLISCGEAINSKNDRFGDCCDFITLLPHPNGKAQSALMWVNHESVTTAALYGKKVEAHQKTLNMVETEMKLVGGSLLELAHDGSRWQVNVSSNLAFRLDSFSKIPLTGPISREIVGTAGNCSGGVTPWHTILSCEENPENFWDPTDGDYLGWFNHFPRNIEDYGWVVEINPLTGLARKLSSLGRFSHEGAFVDISKNGHVVVYMGDDAKFQCLYKFISRGKISNRTASGNSALLDEGTLYVADFLNCKWIELSPRNPLLAKDAKFSKLENILTYTRQAAALVGATPLNRPEAVIVNALDRSVLMALTNNPKAGDLYGSIVKLKEHGNDAAALSFDSEILLHGSPELGLVCPDNLAFSPSNYLWVTNDVSALLFKKKAYAPLQRNGIYNVFHQHCSKISSANSPNTSDNTIRAWPLLFAPPDAELTGPCFHPNGRDLFVSVQHPGEYSFDSQPGFSSHWPLGKPKLPMSTVIGVQAQDETSRF